MLDLSLIPVQDLALQSIVIFDPCPTPAATSYLQALCLAEGRSLSRQSLAELYESPYDVPSPDLVVRLNTRTEDLAVPDLRWAINQIQLCCLRGPNLLESTRSRFTLEDLADWAPPSSCEATTEWRQETRSLFQHVEAVSFVNSDIIRYPTFSLKVGINRPFCAVDQSPI